ncbi:uncharacterized protein KGF55_001156 [Candida pseudojiufengensis]|uniref:uncharacterized protein n=1 Tax=Candida pseudojiufengensis TaxID=497109 RepID=UPI0022254210|nr:uncharacterized protein KGF55_001156 [Candida pseudojiufengensis]KAI5965793.1 hypothetical protein KGF55_001156 [Candida pseudojiufengensis]
MSRIITKRSNSNIITTNEFKKIAILVTILCFLPLIYLYYVHVRDKWDLNEYFVGELGNLIKTNNPDNIPKNNHEIQTTPEISEIEEEALKNPKKFLGDIKKMGKNERPSYTNLKFSSIGRNPKDYLPLNDDNSQDLTFFESPIKKSQPKLNHDKIEINLKNLDPHESFLNFRIYSHNVKNGNGITPLKNGEFKWEERLKDILASIRFNTIDNTIFTLQELYKFQVLDIIENLNTYKDNEDDQWEYYGVGRIDGDSMGEFVPIIYNSKEWEILHSDTFWLNEKDLYMSYEGWDAIYSRICSFIILQNKKSKLVINFFNTHFDHLGKLAKWGSAQLITEVIKQLTLQSSNEWPTFLMGDFNSDLKDESKAILVIKELLRDSTSLTLPGINRYGHIKSTVTGFDGDILKNGGQNIDYIFTPKYCKKLDNKFIKQNLKQNCQYQKFGTKNNKFQDNFDLILKQFGMLHSKFDGKYMSDHRPIVADFKIYPKCIDISEK